jgi:hypothetical protein
MAVAAPAVAVADDLLAKWPHSDPTGLDYREVPYPIVTAQNQIGDHLANPSGRDQTNAQEYDAACDWKRGRFRQLPKVLVEGK